MKCKVSGKKVKLFKIEEGGEYQVISGSFVLNPLPEEYKKTEPEIYGLGHVAWCGSLTGTYIRTSIIQGILEDNEERFKFKTLNSVYEARAIKSEDCRG